MSYDIIGDIHGHARTLEALLERLGYAPIDGVYRHPSRQAVFLGDFIDRGPAQRAVIRIVRPMIDCGSALAVMGNHEFNAIAYGTQHENGEYLRAHDARNYQQHKVFLDAWEYTDDYQELLGWFSELPLWLDLGGLRVVHACWDRRVIDRIAQGYGTAGRLSAELLQAASTPGNWEYEAVETLLKGKEIPLPNGIAFSDSDGNTRQHIRVRWWDGEARSYRDAFLGSERLITMIPDDETGGDHLVEYERGEVPVFIGHYWLSGMPAPLTPNIACLDYSVARPGGSLVAYRWDGERELTIEKFVTEPAHEFTLTETLT